MNETITRIEIENIKIKFFSVYKYNNWIAPRMGTSFKDIKIITFKGDRVVNKYLFSKQGKFLGREAQITRGLWENESKVKGGPFRNYTFYDPLTRRVYMIDLAMYAPQNDKLPYLHRMDVIAKTFRTIFDKEEE